MEGSRQWPHLQIGAGVKSAPSWVNLLLSVSQDSGMGSRRADKTQKPVPPAEGHAFWLFAAYVAEHNLNCSDFAYGKQTS